MLISLQELMIHSHYKGGSVVLGWGRHDNLLGTFLNVGPSFFLSKENSCAINNNWGFGPVTSLNVFVLRDSDFMTVDSYAFIPFFDFMLES